MEKNVAEFLRDIIMKQMLKTEKQRDGNRYASKLVNKTKMTQQYQYQTKQTLRQKG